MSAGDELHVFSAGGGGHGDPLEREPVRVLQDAREGKISRASARDYYGVAIDAITWVDQPGETDSLRRELRLKRPVAGKIFDRGRMKESVTGARAPVVDIGG